MIDQPLRPKSNLIAAVSAIFLALLSCLGLGAILLVFVMWLTDGSRSLSDFLSDVLPSLLLVSLPVAAGLIVAFGVFRHRPWAYWPMVIFLVLTTAASTFIFLLSGLRSIGYLIFALSSAIAVWQFLKNPSIRRSLNVSASD